MQYVAPGTQLSGTGTANGDLFGRGVCVSGDGSTIVVGAPQFNGGGTDRGGAFVFRRVDQVWTQVKALSASDAANGDQFGESVYTNVDGSIIVVGAQLADLGGSNRGAVYVYTGAAWATETKLTASNGADLDRFGQSVAVSLDGSTVVVGAPIHAPTGSVYAYRGTNYATETIITPSGNGGQFGIQVDCSENGDVIIVGSTTTSRAFIYSGASWATEVILSEAQGTGYGFDVKLSGDGLTAAVGSYSSNTNRGSAYIYSGASYATSQRITASNGISSEMFGVGLDISYDASLLVVGSRRDGGAGGAYVFYKDDGGTWRERNMLAAPPLAQRLFYSGDDGCVSLSKSTGVLVLGALMLDEDGPGYAYVLEGFTDSAVPLREATFRM